MSVAAFATAAWPEYPEPSKKNSCRVARFVQDLLSDTLMRFGKGKIALEGTMLTNLPHGHTLSARRNTVKAGCAHGSPGRESSRALVR